MSGFLSAGESEAPVPVLLLGVHARLGLDFQPEGYECNAGGPMSRQRNLKLKSSVLGKGQDGLRCPHVLGAALDFGPSDPVRVVEGLVKKCGFRDTEEAAFVLMPRIGPCICQESEEVEELEVRLAPPEAVLRTALILGHATRFFFDPGRPLVWTRSSLQRRLRLFSPSRFYQA